MGIIIICLLFIAFYVLPAFVSYKIIQLTYYNEKGRMYGLSSDKGDILPLFFPLLNWGDALYWFMEGWSNNSNTNFFKPKDK